MAIGLGGVVWIVPASSAQDSRAPDHAKVAGTGIEADERQTHDEMSDGLRSEAREHAGAIVAVPTGRFRVGPEFVDGEPIYIRRTVRESMATVDVSTTPFMPEPLGIAELIGRPDQPAGW